MDAEHLREALASAKQINAAQAQRLREQDLVLSGIAALLEGDDPDTLVLKAFDVLSQALAFDACLVLEPTPSQGFRCTASTEPSAVGAVWPDAAFMSRVARGRAAVVPANARVPDWSSCETYVPPAGAGLYAPLVTPAGAGLLVLCTSEHGIFSAKDLALVSRLGLLMSQALASAQRRRLARDVQTAEYERRAAVDAHEAMSRFLANMSHEIRTPLNGVSTVAELLAATELSPRQQEMAELVVDSGRMLERLLNDVLDFAKIEAGHLSIEAAPFHLATALTSVFDLFAVKADAKGLGFQATISPSCLDFFEGDGLRVRQVAANLLSNAVKFTEQGVVEVSVEAADASDGVCRIEVRVRDTGCGFSKRVAGRLFNRFEQGDGSVTRRHGGTGLGLAISRSLAQLMGGDVAGSSEPGKGSEFVFHFHAPRASGPRAEQPIAHAPGVEAGLSILLAEDNPNNRRIVGLVLETISAQVEVVENGQEALWAAESGAYSAILMDLQMPVMDGITAIRRIRSMERASGRGATPIIALSANAMVHQVEEALAAGATAHVSKPIRPARLLQILAALTTQTRGEDRAAPPSEQSPPAPLSA